MVKSLPDKWVRKAIYDAVNNVDVDGFHVKVFDTRVTVDINSDEPQHYILMTTQTNETEPTSKCEWNWRSSILLDIVTTFPQPGNPGSRLLVDDITDKVRESIQGLTLDPASNLKIIMQDESYPSDLVTLTKTESVFRKFIRLELFII